MRPLGLLLVYLVAVFGGAALMAPWLYWMVQGTAQSFPIFQSIAANPFHRFVNRSLICLAVLGLWPLLRRTGVKKWSDVGVVPLWGRGRLLGAGLAVGFGSLAVAAGVSIMAGGRKFNEGLSVDVLVRHVLTAGFAGVAVAVVEELVFRGALFGTLRRAVRWPVALVISSVIFGLVHFLQRAEAPKIIGWTTGLEVLAKMLRGVADFNEMVPAFFSLVLVGSVLAYGYQRTGNLYFSVGLHGGWIFWQKSYGLLTVPTATERNSFWGSSKLIDGWFAFMVLALSVTVIFWLLNRVKPGLRKPSDNVAK